VSGFCVGILLMYCFPPSAPEPIEDFCIHYQRVVIAKGDGKITANDDVKRRIIMNERKYQQFCNGAKQ
jgi:hypothetical protein